MNQKGFTIVELTFALFFVVVFALVLSIIGFTGFTVYKTMSGCDYNAAKCVNQAIKGTQ